MLNMFYFMMLKRSFSLIFLKHQIFYSETVINVNFKIEYRKKFVICLKSMTFSLLYENAHSFFYIYFHNVGHSSKQF